MTFVKEGKEMNYEEVVQLIMEDIKKGILNQLEGKEIAGFIRQVLLWHTKKLQQYAAFAGYDIKEHKKLFEVAYQLKMISNKEVWERGEKLLSEADHRNEYEKETFIDFISKELLGEMQRNRLVFMSKERQLVPEENII